MKLSAYSTSHGFVEQARKSIVLFRSGRLHCKPRPREVNKLLCFQIEGPTSAEVHSVKKLASEGSGRLRGGRAFARPWQLVISG